MQARTCQLACASGRPARDANDAPTSAFGVWALPTLWRMRSSRPTLSGREKSRSSSILGSAHAARTRATGNERKRKRSPGDGARNPCARR